MNLLEMETENDSEGVEKGSVELKQSQNLEFCGQIPGEGSVVPCFGGGNVSGINANNRYVEGSFMELIKCFDCGENGFTSDGLTNRREAFVNELVAEENQTTRGSARLDVQQENTVSNRLNDANGQALILEGNKGIGVEKAVTEEEIEQGNDTVQQSEVEDCAKKMDVSGDGFSLFVEVFGPMDGIKQADEGNCRDQQALGEGGSDHADPCKINRTLSSGEETFGKVSEVEDSLLDMMESSSIHEVYAENEIAGEDPGDKNNSFNVGDLVFAKTKKQLWWPGMIADPSNSSRGGKDSHKKDSFLVKYYGNANFIWCSSSQLKHFVEYFGEMSSQNKSRNFRGALERAVSEIGRRVKVGMTCTCSQKENQKITAQSADHTAERYVSKGRLGDLSAFSEADFQPANFLQLVKYVAQGSPVPGKIKLTVTQNCLSAFYHSLGHCQLPMHQLRPTDAKDSGNDGLISGYKDKDLTDDGKETDAVEDELLDGENAQRTDRRSGKGFESRERKKSKYLSYPYVNPKKGNGDVPTSGENVEDLEKVPEMNCNSGKSGSGKKSRKAGSKKSSNYFGVLGKAEDINSSSSEILNELLHIALDYSYPNRRQHSGSVSKFLCHFRRFSFLDSEMANKCMGDEVEVKEDEMARSAKYKSEGTNGKDSIENLSSSGKPKKRRTKKGDGTSAGKSEGTNGKDSIENLSSSGKPKKRRTKKGDGTSAGNILSGSIRNALNSPVVIKCQGVSSDMPKCEKEPSQPKEAGTFLGLPFIKQATGLPDLNGNIPVSSAEDNQVPRALSFLDPSQSNIKFVQLLKDVQAMSPNFTNTIPQHNNMQGETAITSSVIAQQSEANGSSIQFGALLNSFQPKPSLLPGAKRERRKRKKKDKAQAANLPDLNGNTVESISPGNTATDANPSSAVAKSPRKRRRNKSAAAVPGNTATDAYPSSAQAKPPRKRRRNKSTTAVPGITANQKTVQNTVGFSAPLSAPFIPPLLPMDGLRSTAKPTGSNPQSGEPPDLLFIQRNVEMMKSMLEKAGNNLSPEMRTKLETEIKAFMEKISSMVGSSSS